LKSYIKLLISVNKWKQILKKEKAKFLGLWPSGEIGRMTQRHPDVTAQTIVAANANLQVSVGIKHTSEVSMNIQGNNMMNKTVFKIKSLIITVLCISCLSSALLTRDQERLAHESLELFI